MTNKPISTTHTGETRHQAERERSFSGRIWLAVGIVTAVFISLFLLWQARSVILALFAGFLFAIFLHGASSWVSQHTPLPRKAALFMILGLLLLLLILAGVLIVPNLAQQGEALGQQLRDSWQMIQTQLSDSRVGQFLLQQIPEPQDISGSSSAIFSRVSTIFSTTVDTVTRILIVLFVGIYLAYDPPLYINGLLKLAPIKHRPRLRQVFDETVYSLRWWLVGQFISMAIIGTLVTIGLTLLGMPLAPILGLLAGILEFIPIIGPTLAFIPPTLIAFATSPQTAVYVALLYLGVQTVESYIVTPIVQKRAVSLPPVLLIGSQLFLGLFAGFLGLMLAAPLAVVGMVVVKMLYVEDILHDHSVEYLTETRGKADSPSEDERRQTQKAPSSAPVTKS